MEFESIEDIIAEMREYAFKWTKDLVLAKTLEQYADRLEDASERFWDAAYSKGFNDRNNMIE